MDSNRSLPTQTDSESTDTEFDKAEFCDVNNISLSVLNEHLSDLVGNTDDWTVSVEAPDKHSPRGRLHIEHSEFNEWTQITIDNRRNDDDIIFFSVFNPMETDILPVVDDVCLQTAFARAVDRANSELNRQSPTHTHTSITRRVYNRLSSAVRSLQ